jgi:uncharacterized protein YqjF (DUF2071 family)
MLNFLKNHPFAVAAHFESSIVLTFAVPKEQLQDLIPSALTLDTYQDKYAFIAVAMVQTKELRPKGFPKFMGNDFFLIGYRIFVRYTSKAGKNLRGLYIIKSETNKKKMEFLGNIFTNYNYTTTDILQSCNDDSKIIQSQQSKFKVVINTQAVKVALPSLSPFEDWKEARRFAGPLPFTFTYLQNLQKMLIIEGVRQHWTPKPIQIEAYEFDFIKSLGLSDVVLANAFIIEDIPYWWKAGVVERCTCCV